MVTGVTERGVRYGILRTPEGDMKFHKGDYIVKGVCGEIYPVKKEIFEKTYREASDPKKDAPFKDGPDLEKLWAEQEKQLAESDLIVVKKKNLLDVLSMGGQALEGSLLDYKKVKGISVSHEGRVGNCPNCNALVAEFEDKEKCEKCGQKLDWSTENDE